MLDMHLAELYGIETKFLNRAVKRNPNRFPESFMFQISKEENEDLRFQFGTSNENDLNQAVKRNIDRFPEMFRFQFSEEEFENWKSQIVMSNKEKMGLMRLFGKKWFAFSKMEKDSLDIFERSVI